MMYEGWSLKAMMLSFLLVEQCSISMEHGSILCQDRSVTDSKKRPERRSDALTKTRIVEAAVVILDEGGTEALTFRALAGTLATGAGALYHHVANKGELLAASAAAVMREAVDAADDADPADDIRAVMLGVFDAISVRPWLGTQLVAAPWQPAVLQLFDRVGSGLVALGVPERSLFDAASALVHHVLGVASQYDAGLQLKGMEMGRRAFLESAASRLADAQGGDYLFLTRISQQLTDHDDRGQFRAGIEIILAGIATLQRA
jgi:AcrR family transcriptional regulator